MSSDMIFYTVKCQNRLLSTYGPNVTVWDFCLVISCFILTFCPHVSHSAFHFLPFSAFLPFLRLTYCPLSNHSVYLSPCLLLSLCQCLHSTHCVFLTFVFGNPPVLLFASCWCILDNDFQLLWLKLVTCLSVSQRLGPLRVNLTSNRWASVF